MLYARKFYLIAFQVVTKVPFLLKHKLREYQHVGLDWLVTLYDKKLNGIVSTIIDQINTCINKGNSA